MSQSEPKGPYVYQPFGMQDKTAWHLGRIYGVAGISDATRIDGLTKHEAEAVLAMLKTNVLDPIVPKQENGPESEALSR